MKVFDEWTNKRRTCYDARMDEGRKRVLGIMAAILASLHMQTADDLFGGPQGSPRSDKLIGERYANHRLVTRGRAAIEAGHSSEVANLPLVGQPIG